MRLITVLTFLVSTLSITTANAVEVANSGNVIKPDTRHAMCTVYLEFCEGGYANRRTYLPGEEVVVYIANALKSYSVTVERRKPSGAFKEIRRFDDQAGSNFDAGCDVSRGCNWSETIRFTIPLDWRSGLYRMKFPVKYSKDTRKINFVLAEKSPVKKILIIVDTQTMNAYNIFGGESVYASFSNKKDWKTTPNVSKFSFLRPVISLPSVGGDMPAKLIDNSFGNPSFSTWIETNIAPVTYLSIDRMDLFSKEYLSSYPLVVVSDVFEYVAHKQADVLRGYVEAGGSLYFSGREFGLGAIRLTDNDNAMIFYRSNFSADPVFAKTPRMAAVYTYSLKYQKIDPPDPGEFLGVSMLSYQFVDHARARMPLIVVDAEHWSMKGTKLIQGDFLYEKINGVLAGAWVTQEPSGRYCIVSSKLDCDRVNIIALTPPFYYPFHPIEYQWKPRVVVAEIRTGKGRVFAAPMRWVAGPVSTMIQNILMEYMGN